MQVLPFLSMDGMQLLMSLVTFPHELGNVIEVFLTALASQNSISGFCTCLINATN